MLQPIGWPTASKATRLQAIADPAAPLRVSLLMSELAHATLAMAHLNGGLKRFHKQAKVI